MITQEQYKDARKLVDTAIKKYGNVKTALKKVKQLEADAIKKSMALIADYFIQTHRLAAQKKKQEELQK